MMASNRMKLIWTLVLIIGGLQSGRSLAQFSISGTVVDPASAPVDSVEIRLFTDNGFPIGIPPTYTSSTGNYSLAGLPSGAYLVQFRPRTVDKLVAVELPVNVSGSSTVRNANLVSGFLLHGYVRDKYGLGIPSIDLQVWDRDTGDLMLTPGDDTNALGYYDVVVPLGEYDLEWRAVSAGSLPYISVVDRVFIDMDTQIDVVMLVGWAVSGTVWDSLGNPLFQINLDFIDLATGNKIDTPGDNTAVDGTFTVSVPEGEFEMVAKPQAATRLLTGFKPMVVVTGDTVGVDFHLQPGHLLTGTVTGEGTPAVSVELNVIDAVTGQDVVLAFDKTNDSGQYEVVVPDGQIHVFFVPPGGSSLASKLVPWVSVPADLILNANLVNGVILNGTVTAAGNPVPATDLDLKDPITRLSFPLRGDHTDQAGYFETIAAPGVYILEVEPPKTTGLVAQRDMNFVLNTNTNLNIALEPGARVTGTVSASSGGVLADVGLDVLRTLDGFEIFTPGSRTNTLGQYEAIVPPDNYTFFFKLGDSHAVPDSLELTNVEITGDTVVDAVFNFGVSAVDDQLPPVSDLGLIAYPNPFNPKTTVSFEQKSTGRARVTIHRLDGSLVIVLADGEFPAGVQNVVWQGHDAQGQRVASGVYLAAVATAQGWQTTKVALVK